MSAPGGVDLISAEFSALDPETATPKLRVLDLPEFLGLDLAPREYLVEPWLPKKGLVMLHAWRGVGKTWFALALALAVATGENFLKWKCPQPRRVLYVDGEMPAVVLQERLALLMRGVGGRLHRNHLRILAADLQELGLGSLDDPATQAWLEGVAEPADLVVFDNLSTLVRGGIENEAESWGPVQDFLLQLRRRGKTALLVHHQGKNGAQRGTSKREDILDTVIALQSPKSPLREQGAQFRVEFQKSRGAFGACIEPFEATLKATEDGRLAWSLKGASGHDIQRIVRLRQMGRTFEAIGQELGISKATAFRLAKGAGDKGLVDDA